MRKRWKRVVHRHEEKEKATECRKENGRKDRGALNGAQSDGEVFPLIACPAEGAVAREGTDTHRHTWSWMTGGGVCFISPV